MASGVNWGHGSCRVKGLTPIDTDDTDFGVVFI